MCGARRRVATRATDPSARAASKPASPMAAMRQPVVLVSRAVAAEWAVAPAVAGGPVSGVMPYGPVAFAVIGGPVTGVTPYGPFATAVMDGPARGGMPYGRLAFALVGAPVAGGMPDGPLASCGTVPADATAAAGTARHNAHALVTMRRVTMVTSRWLVNRPRIGGTGTMPASRAGPVANHHSADLTKVPAADRRMCDLRTAA